MVCVERLGHPRLNFVLVCTKRLGRVSSLELCFSLYVVSGVSPLYFVLDLGFFLLFFFYGHHVVLIYFYSPALVNVIRLEVRVLRS